MKNRFILLPLLAFTLVGCSTPESRIDDNKAAFNTYPVAIQELIRSGNAAVGFSEEQAKLALGDPDRVYTRTTAAGKSTIWAYEDNSPTFGFGIGGGVGTGGSTRVGTGLGVDTFGDRSTDRLRVVFENGHVSAVEELRE